MKVYDQDEVNRINKIKESNSRLETFFEDKRSKWNETIKPLFKVLSLDMDNTSTGKKILDSQSVALTHKQTLNDEINLFLTKRAKETNKLKKLKQDKFIFYATSFGVKTNLGEKTVLIEGNIAENQRAIELIESYIDFLRETTKNLESFGYSIKNMIELIKYLRG